MTRFNQGQTVTWGGCQVEVVAPIPSGMTLRDSMDIVGQASRQWYLVRRIAPYKFPTGAYPMGPDMALVTENALRPYSSESTKNIVRQVDVGVCNLPPPACFEEADVTLRKEVVRRYREAYDELRRSLTDLAEAAGVGIACGG